MAQPTIFVTVKAIRGFVDHERTPRRAGDIVTVPYALAVDLVGSNKAVRYDAPATPPSPAQVTEVVGFSERVKVTGALSVAEATGKPTPMKQKKKGDDHE